MSDAQKLRVLADWFDKYDQSDVKHMLIGGGMPSGKEVQIDLRRIADSLEALRPLPEGMGKEYLNAMIKMKAFIAGRCFEREQIDQGVVEREAAPSDEDVQKAIGVLFYNPIDGYEGKSGRDIYSLETAFMMGIDYAQSRQKQREL